ncbi:MAG: ubiquinol-cytochrome C chaperone family protein [Magnetococcales bacterium]|nr:ubiquinol-cytochrome C chaperone family protein [Magnetococcales bacterium]
MSWFRKLRQEKNQKKALHTQAMALHDQLVEQALSLSAEDGLAVEDSFDLRFDLVVLFVSAALFRLKGQGGNPRDIQARAAFKDQNDTGEIITEKNEVAKKAGSHDNKNENADSLKGETPPKEQPDQSLSQALWEITFEGFEMSLRQRGVNDVRIGARMRQIFQDATGRRNIYLSAWENGDQDALRRAIRRNVLNTRPLEDPGIDRILAALDHLAGEFPPDNPST